MNCFVSHLILMLIVSLSSLNFQAALGHGYFFIPIDIRVLLAIKGLPIIMVNSEFDPCVSVLSNYGFSTRGSWRRLSWPISHSLFKMTHNLYRLFVRSVVTTSTWSSILYAQVCENDYTWLLSLFSFYSCWFINCYHPLLVQTYTFHKRRKVW